MNTITAGRVRDETDAPESEDPVASDDLEKQLLTYVAETRRFRITGMTFRVTSSFRAGSAVAFVLVHGIGTSRRYLRRLHDRLSETGDVHSVDLPGFGGLPKPEGSPSVAVMAGALGDLMTQLGVERAVLIGHSMGAQWVVELAAQRPGLVASVVVIGPVTDNEHRSVFAQSIALSLDMVGEPVDANALVLLDYLRCGPIWYSKQLRFMLSYPIEQRAAALTVPLLIVRGGNDPVAGLAWCRRLRDSARTGFLVVVPSHRHVVQFTAAGAVASAIISYLPATSVAAGP